MYSWVISQHEIKEWQSGKGSERVWLHQPQGQFNNSSEKKISKYNKPGSGTEKQKKWIQIQNTNNGSRKKT